MTKIALMEITVPDNIDADGVYNFLRKNECRMKLKSLVPNPNDPPIIKNIINIKVVYESVGVEGVARIKDDILLAIKGIKSIISTEIYDENTK